MMGAIAAARPAPPESAQRAGDRLTAEFLLAWADALPTWDPKSEERWDAFLDRRFDAEMALVARLRSLATCQLAMCPRRVHVSLTLSGIHVNSGQGLAEACRAWADKANRSGEEGQAPD